MFKFHFRKFFYIKEFYFAFGIMLAICLASFAVTCAEFHGEYASNLIASYQLTVIGEFGALSFILRIAIPLIAALPSAGIYYYEKKNNVLPVSFARSGSHKRYYFSALPAVFLASFIVVFLPLIINILLNEVTFPSEAVRNVGNHPTSDDLYYIKGHSKYILFSGIYINHPHIYNFIFTFLISAFSGLIGLFTYNMSHLFKKNNYLSFALFFIFSNIVEIISSKTTEHGVDISYFDYLFAGYSIPGKNVAAFGFMILLLAAVIAATVPAALKKLKNGI